MFLRVVSVAALLSAGSRRLTAKPVETLDPMNRFTLRELLGEYTVTSVAFRPGGVCGG